MGPQEEAWLRGRGEPQGGLGIGAGPPAGDPVLRAKTGGGRQWSLWVTGSSCHHLICLLACGRTKMEGDRRGLCPLTPVLPPLLLSKCSKGKGEHPGLGIMKPGFGPCCAVCLGAAASLCHLICKPGSGLTPHWASEESPRRAPQRAEILFSSLNVRSQLRCGYRGLCTTPEAASCGTDGLAWCQEARATGQHPSVINS